MGNAESSTHAGGTTKTSKDVLTFSQQVRSLESVWSQFDPADEGVLPLEAGLQFIQSVLDTYNLLPASTEEPRDESYCKALALHIYDHFDDHEGNLHLAQLVLDETELELKVRQLIVDFEDDKCDYYGVMRGVSLGPNGDIFDSSEMQVTHSERLDVLALYTKLSLNALLPSDLPLLSRAQLAQVVAFLVQRPWLSAVLIPIVRADDQLRYAAAVCCRSFSVSPMYRRAFRDYHAYDGARAFFAQQRGQLEAGDVLRPEETFVSPLDARSCVSRVEVKKLFASGHAPSLLELHTVEENIAPQLCVFKPDDVRSDHACMIMFHVFNSIWERSWLGRDSIVTLCFKVIPLGETSGLMEYVPSVPLREFDLETVERYSEEHLERFLSSLVGSLVACFVLGIRDRHRDNFMIRESDATFFQLDFKHMFNRRTKVIDAPKLGIPRRLKQALIARNVWTKFRSRFVLAFTTLRRANGMIIYLARKLFADLFTDDEIQKCITSSFFLSKTETAAASAVLLELDMSIYSLRKFLKNTVHEMNLSSMPN